MFLNLEYDSLAQCLQTYQTLQGDRVVVLLVVIVLMEARATSVVLVYAMLGAMPTPSGFKYKLIHYEP